MKKDLTLYEACLGRILGVSHPLASVLFETQDADGVISPVFGFEIKEDIYIAPEILFKDGEYDEIESLVFNCWDGPLNLTNQVVGRWLISLGLSVESILRINHATNFVGKTAYIPLSELSQALKGRAA